MNKFDLENKLLASTAFPEDDSLRRALSALPTLVPSHDRLENVLRALASKRELAETQPANLPARPILRRYKKHLLFAVAASFIFGVSAILLRPSQPSEVLVAIAAPNMPAGTTINPEASAEIAQLMVVSQHLEAGLRDLGQASASFSQLYGRKQAELSLATLDTDLAEVMASNSGSAIDQQRALWRERVAVLSAVENGDYRQALFVID